MIPYEFEVKEIIARRGVAVDPHCVVSSPDLGPIKECLSRVKPPYIIKAQVRGWGRAKAGLVATADSAGSAVSAVERIFGMKFEGRPVRYVMVSHRFTVLRELYLSMMVSYSPPSLLILASKRGGVDVESWSAAEGILRVKIDPLEGLRAYMVRRVSSFLEIPEETTGKILGAMYSALWDYNLHLLELNPLAVTEEGLYALDAKAIVDDDALYTNPLLSTIRSRIESELSEEEAVARTAGFSLVTLDGDVAVIGNGAGLTMATLDAVAEAGGRPGLFLDLGGGASAERVRAALQIVLKRPEVKRVLVNILGGITRCDEVARGAVEALRESKRADIKIVFRLSGLMEEEGRRILEEAGIHAYREFEEAIQEVMN